MEGSVSWLGLFKRAHVAKVESDSIIRGKYPHFLPHHSLTQHPITKNKTKNQESARSNIRPAPYQWKARIHYKYKRLTIKICLPILVSFEVGSHRLNYRKRKQGSKQTRRQHHRTIDGSRIYIGETDAGRRRRPSTVQIPNQRLIPRLTRPNPNPNMMAYSGYEFSGAALSNLLVH